MPSDANAMTTKGNVVLYLDKDLVEKSKSLGFNLSKTFENHLKQLITQLSNPQNTQKHSPAENKINMVGRTGFEPVTFCTSSRCPNRARLPALVFLKIGLDSLSLWSPYIRIWSFNWSISWITDLVFSLRYSLLCGWY